MGKVIYFLISFIISIYSIVFLVSILASQSGYSDVVNALIRANASLNIQDINGKHALIAGNPYSRVF